MLLVLLRDQDMLRGDKGCDGRRTLNLWVRSANVLSSRSVGHWLTP